MFTKPGLYEIEFYCKNVDCSVREITIDLKLFEVEDLDKATVQVMTACCPLCQQMVKIHKEKQS